MVLVHGYPVTGHAWEKQEAALLASDHRFITYDRRGFGSSSQPSVGYHYDTFTADLDALLTKLDLQEVTLVGLSMGTGEVTRYLGAYGSQPVSKAVLVAPLLLKTADNPVGLGQSLFDGFMAASHGGRPAWMKGCWTTLRHGRPRRHPCQRPGVPSELERRRRCVRQGLLGLHPGLGDRLPR